MKQMFRVSLFGFDKLDVANFISKQSKQYEKRIAEVEKEKEAEVERLEAVIAGLQEENEELAVYRAKKESDLASFGVIQILAKKIDSNCEALLKTLSDAEGGVATLEKSAEEMMEKLSFAETLKEKARRFDQLSTVLGGIVSGKDPEKALDSAFEAQDVSFEADPLDSIDLSAHRDLIESLISDYRDLVRLIEGMVGE
jgi:hypothetical protein